MIEKTNLKQQLAAQELAAARKGESIANAMRTNLANVKSNLLTQNASLADPTLIASTAANQDYGEYTSARIQSIN